MKIYLYVCVLFFSIVSFYLFLLSFMCLVKRFRISIVFNFCIMLPDFINNFFNLYSEPINFINMIPRYFIIISMLYFILVKQFQNSFFKKCIQSNMNIFWNKFANKIYFTINNLILYNFLLETKFNEFLSYIKYMIRLFI